VVHPVGSARDNVAIIRFATRPLPASPQTSEVLVEVANFGTTPVTSNLEIRYDDRLLDVKPISLDPGARETRVFPSLARPGGNARGHLVARIDSADALLIDNEARALLPPPKPVRVLLVTKGNVFLEKALSAEPGVSYELVAPDGWSEAISAKFDATVYDDLVPVGWESGHALFVGRTPFDSGEAPLLKPVLTDIDVAHPVLRMVELGKVTILRARTLALPQNTDEWRYDAPLRSFENPLLITGERRDDRKVRVTALGLDLTATDLPLRVAFPLLVTNAVHWLAGTVAEPRLPLRCGETIALAGDERIVAPSPVAGFFQPLKNGFYELQRGGHREWIAVNTASEQESDLRRATDAASAGESLPLPRLAGNWIPAWPPWRWLALGALFLAATEWSLFHRRRTE
jgi:hypothetical protein